MTDHAETAISCFEAADELLDSGVQATAELYAASAQAHATLALVEVTERLAVAQEVANDLAFTAQINSLPDKTLLSLDETTKNRVVVAGQRAMKAMGL